MTNKRKQGEEQATWYRDPNKQNEADSSHIDRDPLTSRPRISALVLCLVTGLACLGLAALVWWAAVWTVPGQTYDDMALTNFRGFLDQAPLVKAYLGLFTIPYATVVICVVLGLFALVVVLVRRRWWLLGQVVVYALVVYGAARILKRFLPRPVLIHVRQAFLQLAQREPDRFLVIDATQSIDRVWQIIQDDLDKLVEGREPDLPQVDDELPDVDDDTDDTDAQDDVDEDESTAEYEDDEQGARSDWTEAADKFDQALDADADQDDQSMAGHSPTFPSAFPAWCPWRWPAPGTTWSSSRRATERMPVPRSGWTSPPVSMVPSGRPPPWSSPVPPPGGTIPS